MTRPSILAATVAALLVASCGGNDKTTEPAGSAPVSTIAITSRNHVDQDVDYPQSPPIGGDHNPVWQNCGVYSDPVLDELAVHSLEHGAVWITYRPDLAPGDVERLEMLTNGQTHILLSPYPDLTSPIVASAWGAQQRFETADDAGIGTFIEAFQQGPQTPEPGATCSRGYGEPA